MKIVKLQSENIKRLHAVEVTPEGALVIVGGKNGAGKSSVLDSIAYALGGEKLVPTQPIRTGEAHAKVVIDLSDLIVTRKFHRDYLPCDCGVTSPGDMPIVGDDQMHLDKCASRTKFGPTKSVLIVTNKDGARYPSPQAVLDRLLGKLTFDPLAFSRETPKKQNEILRKLVNIDFSLLDQQRKEAADQRAMVKKTYGIKSAQRTAMITFKDAPPEEISLEAINDEITHAEGLRHAHEVTVSLADKARYATQQLNAERDLTSRAVDDLERRLIQERNKLVNVDERIATAKQVHADCAKAAEIAQQAVPDMTVLRQRMMKAQAQNVEVRANLKAAEVEAEIDALALQMEEHATAIEKIDQAKADALEAAQFPVPGLGLSDDGVTFEGLPLEEVSSSVQLRTSIAIGLALNPGLKVLLIRNGNLLDNDSMRMLAEQAEEADAQIWCEYVTESAEGVAVMLEDGSLSVEETA